MEKTPNYSPEQEKIILDVVRANDNVANLELATELSERQDMYDSEGNKRKPRAITAKMTRMAEASGFKYERKQPTTKDGKPVQKKLDLVKRIAELAGVTVEKLDGMEKSPKLALDTLVAALADAA